jgi:hypothetical protein
MNKISKTAAVAIHSLAERTQSTRVNLLASEEQGPRSSTATPGSAHETGLHSMWRSIEWLALARYGRDRDAFRRHTIRGNRRRTRRTLCAMRSAPRNGAARAARFGQLEPPGRWKRWTRLNRLPTALLCLGVNASRLMAWRSRFRGWPWVVAHGLFSRFYSCRKWARWCCDLGR